MFRFWLGLKPAGVGGPAAGKSTVKHSVILGHSRVQVGGNCGTLKLGLMVDRMWITQESGLWTRL